MIKTIEWVDSRIRLIDQTKLPSVEEYVDCREWQEVAEAIKSMKIRGAPAIGVAAALGIAIGEKNPQATNTNDFLKEFEEICEGISATRPTARNLFWATERMRAKVQSHQNSRPEGLKQILEEEALKILKEDIEINEEMGKIGAELLKDGDNILTHCNAGALATAGYGTALGVIRAAFDEHKKIHIFVDETRPLLQGARLTAWELKKEGIPFTLITDNMAGFLMSQGKIEKVIVGADRIVIVKFFSVLFPLLLFIFLGFFSRKIGLFRKEDVSVLKNVIIYLTLPALVFVVVYRSSFSLSFFKIPALSWGVMFLSLGVALLLTRTLSLKRETSGAFILTSAIGNTGYFGYPLALAFYGNAGFVRSLFYDLFGTVPFVFTIGVYLAENFWKCNKSVNPLRNVFTFPPFLALIAAYLLQFLAGETGAALPSFVLGALDSLGKVTIP